MYACVQCSLATLNPIKVIDLRENKTTVGV